MIFGAWCWRRSIGYRALFRRPIATSARQPIGRPAGLAGLLQRDASAFPRSRSCMPRCHQICLAVGVGLGSATSRDVVFLILHMTNSGRRLRLHRGERQAALGVAVLSRRPSPARSSSGRRIRQAHPGGQAARGFGHSELPSSITFGSAHAVQGAPVESQRGLPLQLAGCYRQLRPHGTRRLASRRRRVADSPTPSTRHCEYTTFAEEGLVPLEHCCRSRPFCVDRLQAHAAIAEGRSIVVPFLLHPAVASQWLW